MTFVKAKLLLERAVPGDLVEIRLKGAEPLINIPRSIRELNHEIVRFIPEEGESEIGIHRLLIRKRGVPEGSAA